MTRLEGRMSNPLTLAVRVGLGLCAFKISIWKQALDTYFYSWPSEYLLHWAHVGALVNHGQSNWDEDAVRSSFPGRFLWQQRLCSFSALFFALLRGVVVSVEGPRETGSTVQFYFVLKPAFLVGLLLYNTVCCSGGMGDVWSRDLASGMPSISKDFVSRSEFICYLMFDNKTTSQHFPFILNC